MSERSFHGEDAMSDAAEIARFHDRCSDLMRELLDALAAHPDEPRPFPAVEDAMGWPRRRIASVLGGVARLRMREFAGARPYHFHAPRDAASRRWEIWMDAAQAHAIRAQSFGRVAEAYDRYRPGYPDALLDDVVAAGGGRGRGRPPRILEAGAGTGRATLALAARGATVDAVEPDPEMADVLRRRTAGLDVRVHDLPFEDCDAEPGAFDVVAAAQCWHWIDPARGPAAAARALAPGGALCAWWNRPRELDGPVWDAIHAAYAEHAPELDRRTVLHEQTAKEAALEPAPGFAPWAVRTYEWTAEYDAEEYAGLVQTHSDHLLLPAAVRARLAEAIRDAIDDAGGGRLVYPFRTVLLTARPA